jgi:hypothetical protein
VATTRRSCDIRVMAEDPIDSDAQLRLTANIDRAIRKGPRRQQPPQSIRLGVERIVRTSKPDATDH